MKRKEFLSELGMLTTATLIAPSALSMNKSTGENKMEEKVRVGIIGCGSVSGVYLPHLTKSPFAEVVSLCDIRPERAQGRAEEYHVKNWYPHIDQMLQGVPFDLLITLTDMQEHGRLNRIALNAGKHVWSEKPLANSYQEGKELLDLALSKGKKIWGAPVVVNSPQFEFMARQVVEGNLGAISAATAHYGHLGPDWSAFFFEELGGSLPDLGVYNIASLTGLFGPVKSVIAMTNVITPERNTGNKGPIKVVVEDNAQLICEHGQGVLSHIMCGFNYFDPYGHGGAGQDRPTISVWGRKGNMHLVGYDWMPFGVDMATEDHEETRRFVPDPGSYVWEEGASMICEHLATGKKIRVQPEHSLHVLEIIEAARESQRTGQRISLQSTFRWPMV